MIYLIKSAAYTEDKTEYEDILKIGYTGENSRKSRFSVYLTENPTIQILYLISNGDEENEKDLHYHFRHLKKYGREWFKYDQEIIDFFETHKTKESLLDIRNIPILSRTQNEKANENKKNNKDKLFYVNIAIDVILQDKMDKEYLKRLEKYLWYNINKYQELIDTEFLEYKEEIKKRIEEFKVTKNIENELQGVYNYLIQEFDKDNNFERRMKLLCDINSQYPTFFQSYSTSPLQCIIPIEYQNYINTLGFERIKALKYKESNIISYIQSQQNLQNSNITSLFSIGSKYSKSQIKEVLREFYNQNSISKTPKATDLLDYFDLKPCQFMENGKKVNGFVILKKGDIL